MAQIPDAPWIRQAEMYGVDEGPTILCPCCGEEAEDFIVDENHTVVGCNHCTRSMDPWDWFERYGDHGD